MPVKTIIEPFRIKSVEPIRWTTREQREELARSRALQPVSASRRRCADRSAHRLWHRRDVDASVGRDHGRRRELRRQPELRSLPQLRAGDLRLQARDSHASGPRRRTHPVRRDAARRATSFPTTRTSIPRAPTSSLSGAEAVDLVIAERQQPALKHPFKGNMDVAALEALIARVGRDRIPLVMLTVTNNSGGGQPVSMENVRQVSAVCRQARHSAVFRRLPLRRECLVHQAAREGIRRQDAQGDCAGDVPTTAMAAPCPPRKMAWRTSADFCARTTIMLAQQEKDLLILTEGYPTYGGLAGRDLEAIAVGIQEALEEDYLRYRIASTAYLGNHIARAGVPIVQPPGGHAIYIDARAFLPHIPLTSFPALRWLSNSILKVASARLRSAR